MDLVPLLARRERAQHNEAQDPETNEDDRVEDPASFDVFQAFLKPWLAGPPARNPPHRQPLRRHIPRHTDDQRVEEKLDQPRRRQFTPGQEWPHKKNRANETRENPQKAQIQMFSPNHIEIDLACQKRRVVVLHRE